MGIRPLSEKLTAVDAVVVAAKLGKSCFKALVGDLQERLLMKPR